MADVPLPSHFVGGVHTPVESLVDAGAEPAFAFYLEGQVNEKLTISDVNSAHYTGDMALASQQAKFSVIDTMLFR